MTPALLAALAAARAAQRPAVLATRLPDGAQRLLLRDPAGRLAAAAPGPGGPPGLADAAEAALRDDACRTVTLGADGQAAPDGDAAAGDTADGGTWFLQSFNPPVRLVVVGAVHIAQALVPMAAGLGFSVTVVDPRSTFASEARFPGVAISTAWPDEAMAALRPDGRTAVVTLTHDPKLDDPALDAALRSEAFCIGALGSRKTHAARLDRLRALGHGEAALARIRGPVGLDIAAVTSEEIALSIAAQLVQERRRAVAPGRAAEVTRAQVREEAGVGEAASGVPQATPLPDSAPLPAPGGPAPHAPATHAAPAQRPAAGGAPG